MRDFRLHLNRLEKTLSLFFLALIVAWALFFWGTVAYVMVDFIQWMWHHD